MPDLLPPIGYALLLWWASTGAVLYAVGMGGARSRTALAGAALLLALSLVTLAATAGDSGLVGVYAAFTAALGVWGAQEIAFLTGWITGPWRKACPAGAAGLERTGRAIQAILYHELALALSGAAVIAVTWGGSNRTGAWTFGVLFAMRISAKLNVFLGVPNLTENFLPDHLAYLKSFFARRPMNLLFPVSVTLSTVLLVWLAQRAGAADPVEATAMVLVAALVALALLEHWFLVLPLPVEALWAWGLRSRDRSGGPAAAEPTDAVGAKVVRLDMHPALRPAVPPPLAGRQEHPRTGARARIVATAPE